MAYREFVDKSNARVSRMRYGGELAGVMADADSAAAADDRLLAAASRAAAVRRRQQRRRHRPERLPAIVGAGGGGDGGGGGGGDDDSESEASTVSEARPPIQVREVPPGKEAREKALRRKFSAIRRVQQVHRAARTDVKTMRRKLSAVNTFAHVAPPSLHGPAAGGVEPGGALNQNMHAKLLERIAQTRFQAAVTSGAVKTLTRFESSSEAKVYYGTTVALQDSDGAFLVVDNKSGEMCAEPAHVPKWEESGVMPFAGMPRVGAYIKTSPHPLFLFRLLTLKEYSVGTELLRYGDDVWLQVCRATRCIHRCCCY